MVEVVCTHREACITIVPGRVASKRKRARVTIVDGALPSVRESSAVLDDVVGRYGLSVIPSLKLFAVTAEVYFVNGDRRGKHVMVEIVVYIIPESCIAKDIPFPDPSSHASLSALSPFLRGCRPRYESG